MLSNIVGVQCNDECGHYYGLICVDVAIGYKEEHF